MEKQIGFARQCSYSARTTWQFGNLSHVTTFVDYHTQKSSYFVEDRSGLEVRQLGLSEIYFYWKLEALIIQYPGNRRIYDFKLPWCKRFCSLSKILPGGQDGMQREAELFQVDSGGADKPCPFGQPELL